MHFNDNDIAETKRINEILTKIDSLDVISYGKITDEIYQYQPFLLTLILSLRFDMTAEALGELIKIILLFWEYFQTNPRLKQVKITEKQFERYYTRNQKMLKYYQGEKIQKDKQHIVETDLGQLQSKALYTAVLYRFKHQSALAEMKLAQQGKYLVILKSVIECYEKEL